MYIYEKRNSGMEIYNFLLYISLKKKKTVGLCSHITYAIKKMNMGKDIRT